MSGNMVYVKLREDQLAQQLAAVARVRELYRPDLAEFVEAAADKEVVLGDDEVYVFADEERTKLFEIARLLRGDPAASGDDGAGKT